MTVRSGFEDADRFRSPGDCGTVSDMVRDTINVLVLNYEMPPLGGGTGAACRQVLEEFARRPGLRCDVVTSGPGADPTRESLSPDIEIRKLPVGKRDPHYWRASELARWTWRAWRACRPLVRRNTYDLCHCWSGWPAGIIGHGLRGRLPYVVSLRGSDVPGYSRRLRHLDPLFFRPLSRRVWREAAAVTTVSRRLEELARRVLPELRAELIRNGVNTTDLTPVVPPEELTLLFVGRLIERKGVSLLLEALAGLRRQRPDAQLIVVGDGPERERLEELARQRGLGECATFLGPVERELLPAIYAGATVFVLPAYEEALPNAALEAMAAGLPVVTTATGAAELIDGNGLVVPPGDAAALQAALETYTADPATLREHGRRSRRIAEGMSWEAVADAYQALYRRVLDSGPAAR
jgi:glycosyltransferase involved in cell wall biosynthesis